MPKLAVESWNTCPIFQIRKKNESMSNATGRHEKTCFNANLHKAHCKLNQRIPKHVVICILYSNTWLKRRNEHKKLFFTWKKSVTSIIANCIWILHEEKKIIKKNLHFEVLEETTLVLVTISWSRISCWRCDRVIFGPQLLIYPHAGYMGSNEGETMV